MRCAPRTVSKNASTKYCAAWLMDRLMLMYLSPNVKVTGALPQRVRVDRSVSFQLPAPVPARFTA